ncbi:MAG: ketopantoate reductase C-terminal domain-containing protein [Terricaulis sp.]
MRTVGRAEGADLEPDIAKHFVDVLRRSSTTNSMLADRLAGRSLEIDARNGVVVRKGRRARDSNASQRFRGFLAGRRSSRRRGRGVKP